jgi:hypothetical protein
MDLLFLTMEYICVCVCVDQYKMRTYLWVKVDYNNEQKML